MNETKPYTTLLGKNYLSFLMSFGFLEKTKDVVILDEKNNSFPFSEPLLDLEKNILHTWGKDLNYRPLERIERYLKPIPVSIIVEGVQVNLGQSPWKNLRELLRKFPQVFGQGAAISFFRHKESNFNETYFNYTARLGEIIFRFKNTPNLNFLTFLENCPVEIKGLFEKFKEGVSNDELFRFLCQAFYQRKIGRSTSDIELFHVFLCLLSPQNEIDQKSFEEDLEKAYRENGGMLKQNSIKDIDFKGRKVWRINFDDEDTLTAKDVYLSRGPISKYQFKISTNRPLYTCVNVKWSFANLPIKYREAIKVILTDKNRMGAFGPYSELRLQNNTLWAQVLVPFEIGSKVEFYKKSITEILKNDLQNLWGQWWENPIEEDMQMGDSLWPMVGRSSISLGKVEFMLPKKLSVKGISKTKKIFGLKNLHYIGNFGGEALGLLSTLMEIKDLRPYK